MYHVRSCELLHVRICLQLLYHQGFERGKKKTTKQQQIQTKNAKGNPLPLENCSHLGNIWLLAFPGEY